MKLSELVLSAQAAANKASAAPDQLARDMIRGEEFAAGNLAREDYPTWCDAFNAQLSLLDNLARQDSPATVAAKKTDAAA